MVSKPKKIGGMEIELYSVSFAKDRMRLKVPTFKVKEAGLRKISSAGQMDSAMDTLKGKSRVSPHYVEPSCC